VTPLPDDLRLTGRELYENSRPAAYADDVNDQAWARLADALSYLLDPVAVVTRPEDGSEAWTVLADPWRCPAEWLPVLAQWAGIRRADAYTEEQLRELIATGGPGFWRGVKANMIAAVRKYFPPGFEADRFLYFEERAAVTGDENVDAYAFRVFTYSFVDVDEDAVRRALFHAKPAGLYPFIYEVRVGQTWGMLRRRKATWADVRADYANWYEVLHDEPLEEP
jgi:hypothetical protein